MWQDSAACKGCDTNDFFDMKEIRLIAQTCGECPVKWECRLDGMLEEHGVWGNTTPDHRHVIRRRMGLLESHFFDRISEGPARRKVVEAIRRASMLGVHGALVTVGFTRDQVGAFFEPSTLDNKARALRDAVA